MPKDEYEIAVKFKLEIPEHFSRIFHDALLDAFKAGADTLFSSEADCTRAFKQYMDRHYGK